jgi:hypothetical protein
MEPGEPRHEQYEVDAPGEPTERERAIHASALGAILALLGRRAANR